MTNETIKNISRNDLKIRECQMQILLRLEISVMVPDSLTLPKDPINNNYIKDIKQLLAAIFMNNTEEVSAILDNLIYKNYYSLIPQTVGIIIENFADTHELSPFNSNSPISKSPQRAQGSTSSELTSPSCFDFSSQLDSEEQQHSSSSAVPVSLALQERNLNLVADISIDNLQSLFKEVGYKPPKIKKKKPRTVSKSNHSKSTCTTTNNNSINASSSSTNSSHRVKKSKVVTSRNDEIIHSDTTRDGYEDNGVIPESSEIRVHSILPIIEKSKSNSSVADFFGAVTIPQTSTSTTKKRKLEEAQGGTVLKKQRSYLSSLSGDLST